MRAWRLGAIYFPGVVLSNISKVSAYNLAQPTERDSAGVTRPDPAHVAVRPELSRRESAPYRAREISVVVAAVIPMAARYGYESHGQGEQQH